MRVYYRDQMYFKRRGVGAFTPRSFADATWDSPAARPIPARSIVSRVKQALDVLLYRADAMYWREDDEFERSGCTNMVDEVAAARAA